MSYVGSAPSPSQVQFSTLDAQAFNGDGSTTAFTLNRAVSIAASIEVTVNNVQQSPYDGSYTVNGTTTLTFSEAPSSGTDNIYVRFLDYPLASITPGDGTVGTDQLQDNITITNLTTTNGASIQGLTVGKGAGSVATNTAVGASALAVNVSGTNNTAIGNSALLATTGSNNVGVGDNVLRLNTSGGANTAFGNQALYSNTTASNNTAVGYQAGYSNTTSTGITAIGYQAFYSNQTGSTGTAVGNQAGYAKTSSGENAGSTFIGTSSGRFTTTGTDNSFVGGFAGYSNTTGSNNIALGGLALFSNTTASNNTAVGYQAGYSQTTGGSGGGYSVFIGQAAGYNSNGGFNVAVGTQAGYNLTTGVGNTFIGSGRTGVTLPSGYYVTTGNANTIVGNYTGNAGGLDIRTASNYIVLSDGDGNPRQIINNVGRIYTHAGTANTNLSGALNLTGEVGSSYYAIAFNHVGGGSQVGSISTGASSTSYNTSSDYRLKTDIQPVTGAVDRVKALNPVNFEWINSGERVDGFIAHETAEVVPEAVHGTKDQVDADGNPIYQGIDQSKLVPLLTAALKEAISRIEQLEADVAALKGQ